LLNSSEGKWLQANETGKSVKKGFLSVKMTGYCFREPSLGMYKEKNAGTISSRVRTHW
jgi:hypothetical protein